MYYSFNYLNIVFNKNELNNLPKIIIKVLYLPVKLFCIIGFIIQACLSSNLTQKNI